MNEHQRRAMGHEEPHTCPDSWRTLCDMCPSLSCIRTESRVEPRREKWRCYCDMLGRRIDPRGINIGICPRTRK